MKWKFLLTVVASSVFVNYAVDFEKHINKNGETIKDRIVPPEGFSRANHSGATWAAYLQTLPVKEHGSKVYDFSGNPISAQSSHAAVIDLDIGTKDLQQCADAIIRLRADYLWAQGRKDEIEFKFTSGHNYRWTDHAEGIRPSVNGNRVSFSKKVQADFSHANFRNYLDIVFMYAGTLSLERDLKKISRGNALEVGDIIIKGGSPGHAVIVVDRTQNRDGDYIYLLAQGFTPAQSIHILKSDSRNISPWYEIPQSGPFITDRYYFPSPEIRRF